MIAAIDMRLTERCQSVAEVLENGGTSGFVSGLCNRHERTRLRRGTRDNALSTHAVDETL